MVGGVEREKWSSGWEISSIFATMTAQSSLKRKKEERIRIQLDKVSRADGWERETFSIIKAERVVVDRSGLLLSKEEKYHQLTLLSHPPHHVVVFHRLCAIWIFLLYTNWKEKNSTGNCNLTKILQPSLKNRTRPPPSKSSRETRGKCCWSGLLKTTTKRKWTTYFGVGRVLTSSSFSGLNTSAPTTVVTVQMKRIKIPHGPILTTKTPPIFGPRGLKVTRFHVGKKKEGGALPVFLLKKWNFIFDFINLKNREDDWIFWWCCPAASASFIDPCPILPLVDKSTSPQELTGLLFLSSQESRILYSKSRQFPPFFSMFERKKLFR